MSERMAILIIGPSWVGDMVMAQSLFIALKQQHPHCEIDVLAPAWTRPLLDRMPEVRAAIDMPVTHGMFAWQARKEIGKSLQGQYDQAIVLPNSWKSALIPWFAKIPKRTGWLGEMRYGLLNDIRKLDKHALPLMVERFVALAFPKAQSSQMPSWQPPAMKASAIDSELNPVRENNQQRLILCPGAEFGPAKQWPVSHYGELANHFLTQGWQVLILGSKADKKVAGEIVGSVQKELREQLYNLAGKTQLAEAIDLLATADQVVTNDSGLMHVASALNRPLLAIYGPTSPSFTPPLSQQAKIVQIPVECGPCFKRTCPEGHHSCMQELTAASVIYKLDK
ncbi:lipopolysaccharide heptosyltransferase II [Methylophaga sp. OBS3]|uniref:lipopolysaccharide heptosyltransferase II n=1 Tax=Methylophaga sp. OBS3 TaxID=2991934 RepID=UPI00224D8FCC|nr:lipopolysaccharide heptosyltransferase II [Methylophaga sp. OBS3]MCX4190742.1 lipopolysaccharide heptosyltransferase II [Methylophaga sp. OBS3]